MTEMVLIDGQYDTRHRQFKRDGVTPNPRYGIPYTTVDFAYIWNRAQQPPFATSKADSEAVMPHNYSGIDLREAKPADDWKFWLLSADIDSGNYDKQTVVNAVSASLGAGFAFVVTSTYSAWTDVADADGVLTNKGARWAVYVALEKPLTRMAFTAFSEAFLDLLEVHGLKIDDRSSAQPKRLRFLPALRTDGQGQYDYHLQPGNLFFPGSDHAIGPLLDKHFRQSELDALKRLERQSGQVSTPDGARSIIAAYRRKHPTTRELLEWLGFSSVDGGDNWHHESQGTRSYATELYEDGTLYTRSATVGAMGGNYDGNGGWYFGDTYDIMAAVHYKGDRDAMAAYARSCLAEEDLEWFGPEVLAYANQLGAMIADDSEFPMWADKMPLNVAARIVATQQASVELQANDIAMTEALEARAGVSVPEASFVDADDVDSDNIEPELYNGPPIEDPWFAELLREPQLPKRAPPGIVGELFKYARANTVTAALPEMLLPMSLAFTSAMALNAYYVERTGINNAYVVVADTAIGKSTSFSPFRAVLRALDALDGPFELPMAIKNTDKENVPTGGFNFVRGWPSHGNSYHKRLGINPVMLAFVDEFGAKLLSANAGANSIDKTVVDFMTAVITASGPNNSMEAKDYTDSEKSVGEVMSPSFNLIGCMVPEQWEKAFTREAAKSGAANRRLVFEEKRRQGLPVPSGAKASHPEKALVQKIATLTNYSFDMGTKAIMIEVKADCVETAQYMAKFNSYIRYQNIRRDRDDDIRNMWARIYVHCLKVAATVAVGVDHQKPLITLEMFRWAQQLVAYSHSRIIWRLENGQYDGNPNKAFETAKDAIVRYINMTAPSRKSHANASGALLDPACKNIFRTSNIAALLKSAGVFDSRTPPGVITRETTSMLSQMADAELISELSEIEVSMLGLKYTRASRDNTIYKALPVLV